MKDEMFSLLCCKIHMEKISNELRIVSAMVMPAGFPVPDRMLL